LGSLEDPLQTQTNEFRVVNIQLCWITYDVYMSGNRRKVVAAPTISIIIPVWNNNQILSQCLKSLENQAFNNFEIILIYNGSSQNVLDVFVSTNQLINIRVRKLSQNQGFAVANNIGARLARGKWLALLNADAFPQPEWLENLLAATRENPEYTVFTSQQIQFHASNFLDGTGDSYHVSGLAWRRYYNRPVQEYGSQTEEVFSACPAAALYLRDDFLQAGGFDEDYFSYFEDVDLGFRLRLAGKKCLYVPDAVVHHVGSASTGKRSDFSVYYGYRNMIWTFFKDMPLPLIWFLLPVHITTLLFFIFYLSLRGQGKVILRAVFDAIKGMPKVLEKRKEIQRNIKVKPSELLRAMSTGLFEPYTEFIYRNNPR